MSRYFITSRIITNIWVGIEGLLAGELNINEQIAGNMRKLKFYVCPQCGNLMTSTGESNVSCCGKTLETETPKKVEAGHELKIEEIDGELYVTSKSSIFHLLTLLREILF